MKKITITSKPMKPGIGQTKIRYDLGKYRESLVGKTIEAGENVSSIWCYRSRDKDIFGNTHAYYGLMCVVDNQTDIPKRFLRY